jgi:hypothetical protein
LLLNLQVIRTLWYVIFPTIYNSCSVLSFNIQL